MLYYGIIIDGKVAEWLKALVLKTRDGNVRRFESCPFRQDKKKLAEKRSFSSILKEIKI